jgi:hypothetical protein
VSFLTELKSLAGDLEAEGHALADKAKALFGTTEKVIAGVVGELRPLIVKDVTDLLKLAEQDGRDFADQAVQQLRADVAELKALVEQAIAPAPAPEPNPAPVPAPAQS